MFETYDRCFLHVLQFLLWAVIVTHYGLNGPRMKFLLGGGGGERDFLYPCSLLYSGYQVIPRSKVVGA